MNIKEFAGVDSSYKDLCTGRELEWKEYMARVINKIGVNNIAPYIPFELKAVREALKSDEHLNNLPLRHWDIAAEQMKSLLHYNGITTYSLSERVCILKETARMLCKGKE